jgi:diadenosine tetraphosphate (Ap4A) HIT family hydrolase
MTLFQIDPRLEKDSFFIEKLGFCQVRLQNQRLVPWLILVPERENHREWIDLSSSEQTEITEYINLISHLQMAVFQPFKLNIGLLGNVVPQLHIHIIGRFENDPAWPNPVWGNLPPTPYEKNEKEQVLAKIRHFLLTKTA